MVDSHNVAKVREALVRSFQRFLQGYREWGGFRFYGWKNQEDPRNYRGPAIWSEADAVLRFGRELEAEFPNQVHAEFNIANWTRSDYEKAKDGNQRIDLTVSDLTNFAEHAKSQQTFRELTHCAFIEAKWFPKGWWGETWGGLELQAQMASVEADAQRLARHLHKKRCLVAAVLVVDDECFFDEHRNEHNWPEDVLQLVASPRELLRQGLSDEATSRALERIAQLKEGDRARAEEREAEQARLKDVAVGLLQRAPSDLERAVKDLRVMEFEAVMALAIAEDDQAALGILAGHATRQAANSKKWRQRLQRIEEALERG